MVEKIQVRICGMDQGMDQATASEENKDGTYKKDPAALDLVPAYFKAAGSECPYRDQQTYYANKNFLNVMILEQEFF
jgi:hypothetical protein